MILNELPENWAEITLETLCRLDNGSKEFRENLPLLDVKYLRGKKEAEYIDSGVFLNGGQYVILVDGENSGEVFRIHEKGYMGSTFKRLLCSDERLLDYLLYILKFNQKKFRENKKGSAIPHLDKKLFKELLVPLPPLAEQGRIVAKIEELFTEIDAGIQNLRSVQNQIKLYRQSVLKNAFSNLPFENLEKFIEKPRYGTSKKCLYTKNDSSIPVYRIPNIDFEKGEINLEDLKYAHFSNDEKNALKLQQGDLLFIRSNGSLNLVGRSALITKETQNALFAGYLIRIRVKEKLNPKFLLFFFIRERQGIT